MLGICTEYGVQQIKSRMLDLSISDHPHLPTDDFKMTRPSLSVFEISYYPFFTLTCLDLGPAVVSRRQFPNSCSTLARSCSLNLSQFVLLSDLLDVVVD